MNNQIVLQAGSERAIIWALNVLKLMVFSESNHFPLFILPLSPPAPFSAALLSCDVLPGHCWTPAEVSLAPQLWPGDPRHRRSPSSLRLTVSQAEGDAPAWGNKYIYDRHIPVLSQHHNLKISKTNLASYELTGL